MLLRGYKPEISSPTCNSHFQSVHCIAHLDEDIGEALPYLNAVLGGDAYIKDPSDDVCIMKKKLNAAEEQQLLLYLSVHSKQQ